MPTRNSHPGGGGGDHNGHILNPYPTVGGRGRETRAHPAHCPHPGQGDVSPGPASRLLARGHRNQLGHRLAGPKRAGPDLPTAVGGGRVRPTTCHFVCPQAVGPERGQWPAPRAATCQATVPGAAARAGRGQAGPSEDGRDKELGKCWPQTNSPAGSETTPPTLRRPGLREVM